ncbi:MAG: hypothetical protein BWY63_02234 [Chloroflexi bacterium ADurb.Bin360]|nr:MAG: hypothetical protein BWY63_02234 [Chloroflexi bacterium ADurb.Bin360]
MRIHQDVFGHLQIAQLPRQLDILFQTAPGERDLAPVLMRQRDNLLQACQQRGERSNDDAASLCLGKKPVEGLTHDLLGFCETGLVCVGAVAEHGEHAVRGQFAQARQVGCAPTGGCFIHFVISGMDNFAHRGIYHQTYRVGNGVRHGE